MRKSVAPPLGGQGGPERVGTRGRWRMRPGRRANGTPKVTHFMHLLIDWHIDVHLLSRLYIRVSICFSVDFVDLLFLFI